MSEVLRRVDPRIEETILFIKNRFREKSHYSFDDWTIMYGHSVNTLKYALSLTEGSSMDKTVVGITALLHDIGKTIEAEPDILLTQHEELGFEASQEFLDELAISDEQRKQIQSFFGSDDENGNELRRVIKDADYVSFYTYPRLQDAFKAWTDRDNLPHERARKINRYATLSPLAQEMSRSGYEKMKEKWGY
jgi:putative nucleotidyltransferase with HDIG domain